MGKQITNCSECAYVDKSDSTFWCPFHDVPVSNKLVCDDFMDEYESPQWTSLADGMNGQQEEIKQFYPKDIFMYVVTGFSWFTCLLVMIIYSTK